MKNVNGTVKVSIGFPRAGSRGRARRAGRASGTALGIARGSGRAVANDEGSTRADLLIIDLASMLDAKSSRAAMVKRRDRSVTGASAPSARSPHSEALARLTDLMDSNRPLASSYDPSVHLLRR